MISSNFNGLLRTATSVELFRDMNRIPACKMTLLEFSLNDFLWIQRIQWIMTKYKSGMVTKGITHLLTDTLPVLVIKSAFSLLSLGRYPLALTTLNRYQSKDSSEKFFFTTISRNVTIVRCRMSLVTILVLDFLSWFTEFRESHLGKTLMSWFNDF